MVGTYPCFCNYNNQCVSLRMDFYIICIETAWHVFIRKDIR